MRRSGIGDVPKPAHTPIPAAPVPPRPSFPSINVGEPVRFQFTTDDNPCVGGGGRCRSYDIIAPVSGQLDVVLRSVSGDPGFTVYTEMYVVPGADSWIVSGARLTASLPASTGTTYEIRMYSPVVPSVELELLASLRQRAGFSGRATPSARRAGRTGSALCR